ncbi:MAG: IS200/IS605 family transposase [Eubacteriaceae bacterium]|nr:IS200/IS605 family transposase [Eubacteriaceae bacterium]
MNGSSLSHTRHNCTCNIVFIPKYRRKAIFCEVRIAIGEILGKLCEMKGVTLIEGGMGKDHARMFVSIPLKIAVCRFMGYFKGKSALMIFDRCPQYKTRGQRNFWARGCYVATVGNANKDTIREAGWRTATSRASLRGCQYHMPVKPAFRRSQQRSQHQTPACSDWLNKALPKKLYM